MALTANDRCRNMDDNLGQQKTETLNKFKT